MTNTKPTVSVAICTYNRAVYLRKAIQSLVEQTAERDSYEIIVVDNNSTDRTKDVVAEFSDIPNVRYVFEPVQGLCQARNTGCDAARGDYIAYLDDDGMAVPEWVHSVMDGFAKADRPVCCIGGPIDLVWESPRPNWMPDETLCFYATLSYDADWKYIDGRSEYLGGGNSAYPTKLLKELGGFDVALGHKGKKIRYSEETVLHIKMRELGYDLAYHSGIRLLHHVSPERATYEWMRKRIFWQAYSEVQLQRNLGELPQSPSVYGALRTLRKILPRPDKIVQLYTRPSGQDEARDRFDTAWSLGRAYGLVSPA